MSTTIFFCIFAFVAGFATGNAFNSFCSWLANRTRYRIQQNFRQNSNGEWYWYYMPQVRKEGVWTDLIDMEIRDNEFTARHVVAAHRKPVL